jgi:hypothetical protein
VWMGADIAAAHGGGGHFGGGRRFRSVKEDAMNRFIRALVARFLAALCSVALPHESNDTRRSRAGPVEIRGVSIINF